MFLLLSCVVMVYRHINMHDIKCEAQVPRPFNDVLMLSGTLCLQASSLMFVSTWPDSECNMMTTVTQFAWMGQFLTIFARQFLSRYLLRTFPAPQAQKFSLLSDIVLRALGRRAHEEETCLAWGWGEGRKDTHKACCI